MEFCYLVHQSKLDEESLNAMDQALKTFHVHRQIFQDLGVRPTGFSLPRQHALTHYKLHIKSFGAPNGLCSSITESHHIKAVKEPWQHSNQHEPLGQMLITNQQLDKLQACCIDFTTRALFQGPDSQPPPAIDYTSATCWRPVKY